MKNINGPLKVGIGGPVGAGKTSLTAALCKFLSKKFLWLSYRMIFIQKKMLNFL